MLSKKNWMMNQLSQNLRQLPQMERSITLIDNYIDDVVYIFGASLKDAGKKLFAYIKMQETSAAELLKNIAKIPSLLIWWFFLIILHKYTVFKLLFVHLQREIEH